MSSMASNHLIYGFDPLCGWCFGFIPALEALNQKRPDIPIELRLGGLVCEPACKIDPLGGVIGVQN